jgi:hypothetical protein
MCSTGKPVNGAFSWRSVVMPDTDEIQDGVPGKMESQLRDKILEVSRKKESVDVRFLFA